MKNELQYEQSAGKLFCCAATILTTQIP